jgi:tetratricopeptide (TPR) repeat protein
MSPSAAEPRRVTFRRLGWPAVALLLGLLSFANSLPNDFTYDDNSLVRANPRIRSLTNFREIWLTDWWRERTEDEPLADPARDRLYRPLTLFSFALNYALHQARPLGYHVVNVLLHAAVCLLVWSFARRLFDDELIAGIAAVLFAVHPVHSEAVAGIVGRGEILAAGFMLLGLLTLLPRGRPASARRTLLAGPLFFAALLSKETAVCFPAVALVALHWVNRERRLPLGWWLARAALLLVPLAAYLPLRYLALEERFVRDKLVSLLFVPLYDADLAARLHGPVTILGHYARLLLLPSRLSCDYGVAVFDPRRGPELLTLVGFLAAAALLVALIGYWRTSTTWRRLAMLAAMFLASYALISNTLLLIGVSLAERLMYWPSVPALLAVAVAVVWFWQRYCRPGGTLHGRANLLRLFGVLLIAALGLRSVVRNSDWKNDETLFTADLKTYPKNAHLNSALARIIIRHARQMTPAIDTTLAAADQAAQADDTNAHDSLLRRAEQLRQQRQQMLARAENLLDRALAVESRFPDALTQLGTVCLLRGDEERALRSFEDALLLDPLDTTAQRQVARLRGDLQAREARVAELRAQVEQQPNDPSLRLALGRLLIELGRPDEALPHCAQAAQLAPDSTEALKTYADALLLNRREQPALEVYQRVLALDPTDWQVHTNMVKLLSSRDPAAALQHAQSAFQLRPNDLRTQINLAEALALNGRTTEALRRLHTIARNLPADHPMRRLVTDRIGELERKRP